MNHENIFNGLLLSYHQASLLKKKKKKDWNGKEQE